MKHHTIKSLAAIALGAMLLTAVGCEKENDNEPAGTTDTVPQQPEAEPFSLWYGLDNSHRRMVVFVNARH